MQYCPYTDQYLPEDEMNSEHIIPLSLGGINGFEIPVSEEFNSKAGSKIDGSLANDFWILGKRTALDVRGHSNKKPVFKVTKAINIDTNKPIQIVHDKDNGTAIWCPITRKNLTGKVNFRASLTFQRSIELRFVAKVFLSSGYYCYGEHFKNNVNHDEARIIMNSTFEEMIENETSTLVDDRFSSDDNETLQVFRAICEFHKSGSIVGIIPHESSIGIFVGILGIYIGVLNVPAHTENFPNSGEYDLGHIMLIENGELKRQSYRGYLAGFLEQIEKKV